MMGFTSSSIRVHLLRGVGGLGALALALRLESTSIWWALALLPVALWLLKGCPMCWTIGLFETVGRRLLARHEALPDDHRVTARVPALAGELQEAAKALTPR